MEPLDDLRRPAFPRPDEGGECLPIPVAGDNSLFAFLPSNARSTAEIRTDWHAFTFTPSNKMPPETASALRGRDRVEHIVKALLRASDCSRTTVSISRPMCVISPGQRANRQPRYGSGEPKQPLCYDVAQPGSRNEETRRMHVVVHIGPYKTGSTAIQYALKRSSEALRAHGILYFLAPPMPARSLSTLFDTDKSINHPQMRRHFSSTKEARRWSANAWQEFEALSGEPDLKLCVISSEYLSSVRDIAGFLARLRARFDRVTILAYARDPLSLYLSSLQQNIQGGRTLRDLRTPASYRLPYRKFLPTYVETVGIDNVIVRSFARDNLDGGDVVTDFGSQLRRFADVPEIEPVRTNESLPGAALAWLLTVNETWDRKVAGPNRRKVLRRLLNSPEIATLPKLRLENQDFARAIRARTRADCLWLNETFLQGQTLLPVSETDELPDLQPDALRAEMRDWIMSYLTPDALRLIAADVIRMDP